MRRREVTHDERRLWKEATARDKKFRAEAETHEEEASAAPPTTQKPPQNFLAPPVAPHKKKVAAAPRQLDTRAAKRELKKYPLDATLDLHGLNQSRAHEAVMRLLSRARANSWRHLLIITGKGAGEEGILRRALPLWLEERGTEVMAIAPANREKGGSGALHVLLRRPR